MNDLPKLGQSFRGAASMSSRQAAVQERVREALTRMNERFEKCEPQLTLERYRELLIKQGSAPELKPAGRHDNPGNRLWKAAKYQVKQEHHKRCSKIIEVARRMRGHDRGLER